MIFAGQGIHYAKAWTQLQALAELLEAPVVTTLGGKSAFPETHPLSLGSGGIGIGEHLWHMLQNADLIFGIGCSLTRRSFNMPMPKGKKMVHVTLDPAEINKDMPVELGRGRRCRPGARRADRRGEGPAQRQAARPAAGVTARDPRPHARNGSASGCRG